MVRRSIVIGRRRKSVSIESVRRRSMGEVSVMLRRSEMSGSGVGVRSMMVD